MYAFLCAFLLLLFLHTFKKHITEKSHNALEYTANNNEETTENEDENRKTNKCHMLEKDTNCKSSEPIKDRSLVEDMDIFANHKIQNDNDISQMNVTEQKKKITSKSDNIDNDKVNEQKELLTDFNHNKLRSSIQEENTTGRNKNVECDLSNICTLEERKRENQILLNWLDRMARAKNKAVKHELVKANIQEFINQDDSDETVKDIELKSIEFIKDNTQVSENTNRSMNNNNKGHVSTRQQRERIDRANRGTNQSNY